MDKKSIGMLGALLSDLTAYTWSFCTEGETGASLAQRKREIRATLNAIAKIIDEQ